MVEHRDENCELSIVMPCLNESETLATCIDKAMRFMEAHGIAGEVVIADNGSSDGSQAIAATHGARVVPVPVRGYGAALSGGIQAARGRYVIMADADDSYDLVNLMPFVEKLREGYDLVMGNRFQGGIAAKAMPPLHRYLGNPVLTGIGRLFFRSPVGDFHCGLRGFDRTALLKLDLQTTGMEFASEMVVKATLNKLRITEVPTTLSPDGRSRAPHLRSWRDGWRHLRFLLVYCPRWLFLYPGLLLMGLGLIVMATLIPGARRIGGVVFDIHTMLYAAMAVIVGFQSVAFALFSKIFAIKIHLLPEDKWEKKFMRVFTLERGLMLGAAFCLVGLITSVYALFTWGSVSFGPLEPVLMMRITIPALACLCCGIQMIFASFFLSVLDIRHQ
ncbi:MAG: glycosyltransferase family 2 protein [Deltaproteobacteria bacterium]|nr:glycosyltransferase family 2 protein [Deltaproteobacteria bacterium]